MQALKCKSTEMFARLRKILGLKETLTMAAVPQRALRRLKSKTSFLFNCV